jgi:hypothetical protein
MGLIAVTPILRFKRLLEKACARQILDHKKLSKVQFQITSNDGKLIERFPQRMSIFDST